MQKRNGYDPCAAWAYQGPSLSLGYSSFIEWPVFQGYTPLMIYLHKLLPWLLMPLTWAGVLLWLGIWKKNRGVLLGALMCLWIPSLGIVSDALMRLTERHAVRLSVHDVPPAQAVVVLSGMRTMAPAASGQARVAEWNGAIDRLMAGVDLWKNGHAPWLVLTSARLPWEDALPESHDLQAMAVAWGVAPDRILSTSWVEHTEEEAQAVAQVLSHLGEEQADGASSHKLNKVEPSPMAAASTPTLPSVILVTSAFHMPRAKHLFERQGIPVSPFPVDFQVNAAQASFFWDWLPSAQALSNTHLALRALYGEAFARCKGWVYAFMQASHARHVSGTK
jgi:uncharacterized SAM-binding protein YcdF (DUF218 family)